MKMLVLQFHLLPLEVIVSPGLTFISVTSEYEKQGLTTVSASLNGSYNQKGPVKRSISLAR